MITRRNILATGAAGAAFAMTPLMRAMAQTPSRPNIVLIIVDDLNTWLPGYPHPGILQNVDAKFPNFKRLADRSTVFRNAFCEYPHCEGSRYSMLSGASLFKSDFSKISRASDPNTLPRGTNSDWLPSVLKNSGYRIVGAGKVFNVPDCVASPQSAQTA